VYSTGSFVVCLLRSRQSSICHQLSECQVVVSVFVVGELWVPALLAGKLFLFRIFILYVLFMYYVCNESVVRVLQVVHSGCL